MRRIDCYLVGLMVNNWIVSYIFHHGSYDASVYESGEIIKELSD